MRISTVGDMVFERIEVVVLNNTESIEECERLMKRDGWSFMLGFVKRDYMHMEFDRPLQDE